MFDVERGGVICGCGVWVIGEPRGEESLDDFWSVGVFESETGVSFSEFVGIGLGLD